MRTRNAPPLRRLLWGAAGVAAVAVLAACSSTPSTDDSASPDRAPTTVSAPSAGTDAPADGSSDDPISAQLAWSVCHDAVVAEYGDTATVFGYTDTSMSGEPTVTDRGDGTFQVWVAFRPTSGEASGAEALCIAGGSTGAPTVELSGGRDAG